MIKVEDARIRTGKAISNRDQARVEPIGMKIAEKSDKGEYVTVSW